MGEYICISIIDLGYIKLLLKDLRPICYVISHFYWSLNLLGASWDLIGNVLRVGMVSLGLDVIGLYWDITLMIEFIMIKFYSPNVLLNYSPHISDVEKNICLKSGIISIEITDHLTPPGF